MAHEGSGVLPDLHSEVPNICIPVHSVGHVGVKRIVAIDEHDGAAMVVMDISVGLYAHQRGAHMSRLIECVDRPGPEPTVLDYVDDRRQDQGPVPDGYQGHLPDRELRERLRIPSALCRHRLRVPGCARHYGASD
jgi:Type I GTP cyclohydrolase folE2